MTIKSRKAVTLALKAIADDIESLKKSEKQQDKVLESHGVEIAQLQKSVMEMRNRAIAAEAKNRVPYKNIKARYGVSESRISQIKSSFDNETPEN